MAASSPSALRAISNFASGASRPSAPVCLAVNLGGLSSGVGSLHASSPLGVATNLDLYRPCASSAALSTGHRRLDMKACFQQGLKRQKFDKGFISISNAITIKLKAGTKQEIDYNVRIFPTYGVIYRFRGFWPSLPQLHA
ncbi:hypothetical protein SUGI_0272210 [Cryptomeria japonica]|nr:hypothetical protein SUGI_0272210 [Cryptomeria japonica]